MARKNDVLAHHERHLGACHRRADEEPSLRADDQASAAVGVEHPAVGEHLPDGLDAPRAAGETVLLEETRDTACLHGGWLVREADEDAILPASFPDGGGGVREELLVLGEPCGGGRSVPDGGAVHLHERGDGVVPEDIARVVVGEVRPIRDVGEMGVGEVLFDLLARDGQQRPNDLPAPRRDAAEALQSRAAGEAEEHGLELVGGGVRGGHASSDPVEHGIAQLPRGRLDAASVRGGVARDIDRLYGQRHVPPCTKVTAEGLIAVALVPAQPVLHMDGGDLERERLPDGQQTVQKADTVRAAGEGGRDARAADALRLERRKDGIRRAHRPFRGS